jgi:hypothetical protein
MVSCCDYFNIYNYMFISILKLFGLVILQNASFTWVSRARNSPSIIHHTIAATFSNGIWLLVIREVIVNYSEWYMMVTYLTGAVLGSVGMHYISMKYLEKK